MTSCSRFLACRRIVAVSQLRPSRPPSTSRRRMLEKVAHLYRPEAVMMIGSLLADIREEYHVTKKSDNYPRKFNRHREDPGPVISQPGSVSKAVASGGHGWRVVVQLSKNAEIDTVDTTSTSVETTSPSSNCTPTHVVARLPSPEPRRAPPSRIPPDRRLAPSGPASREPSRPRCRGPLRSQWLTFSSSGMTTSFDARRRASPCFIPSKRSLIEVSSLRSSLHP